MFEATSGNMSKGWIADIESQVYIFSVAVGDAMMILVFIRSVSVGLNT